MTLALVRALRYINTSAGAELMLYLGFEQPVGAG